VNVSVFYKKVRGLVLSRINYKVIISATLHQRKKFKTHITEIN